MISHAPDVYGLPIEQQCIQRPPSASLHLFSRVKLRSFRSDGYEWRKKRSDPRQVDETHCKLKIDGQPRLVCYYATTLDNTLQRRTPRAAPRARHRLSTHTSALFFPGVSRARLTRAHARARRHLLPAGR